MTVPSTFLFSFRTSGHVATGYGRKADRCSFVSRSVDGFGQKVVLQAFFPWRARGPVLLDALGHVIDLKSELVLLPKSSRIQALGLTRSLSNLQLLSLIAKGALQVDCPAFEVHTKILVLMSPIRGCAVRDDARWKLEQERYTLLHLRISRIVGRIVDPGK